MHVQIYTHQTPEEALAVIEAGAQHIGITPSQRGLPGEVDIATARAIVEVTRGKATSVGLTVETELAPILEMARAVQPDILHLCPLTGTFTTSDIRALRAEIPGVRLMWAVPVAGKEAIDEALAFQEVVEYIILDTQALDIPGIGASGKTHDWNVSREIVERVRIPVILAGGLSPENVADAIRTVKPWGVDSLTHTNSLLPDGSFRKDIARVRQFVLAAQSAVE